MRITVKLKLAAAFGAIIVLSGVTAGLGISNLQSLNAAIDNLLKGPVARLEAANQLYDILVAVSRAERSELASPNA